ncbi:amidohydrolase family protein [Fluoribacter gormanii]|uniref:2,3-dihydroxybenzoate decarboxylase n=1 Tax=Fluoribacter gormanii TaxID=464 RepID=A0A377GIW9_9GAMM|nr:amidohydrolase family protein [Fluoribacter gormanii]KTD00358.1 5-carboxyvanillate decarboxylase [Fluoribacter gormanii]MCW8443709.1 amidohydrolase family protein [Fluoribacter gormanii]SIQ92479.1 2,3-dihydroxybenzoate decarboxylase [Fluoribacter gormanii]STO24736.1 Predicted metal-dependent hydrolase of the TIM-barrel fold [Fluoribacter gormanii]
MKRIALEEAIVVPGRDLILEHKSHFEFSQNLARLKDIHQLRIESMDEAGIDLSVLSVTTPGLQSLALASQLELCAQKWNDYLIDCVTRSPSRFRAFACVPTYAPELAIKELERIQGAQEIVGCLINGYDSSNYTPAKYLDEKAFDEFWGYIHGNNIPVYLHPRGIPEGRVATYSPYQALHGSTWGFHVETAEHVLRLMLSGLFDKYPNLKIIIGHMGEMLPFWAWRLDHRLNEEGWREKLECKRTITEYLNTNIFLTTSGFFDTPSLMHAISTVSTDRIMFSVDYPYEDNLKASQWLDSVQLDDEDKMKISYLNAAKLLNI